MELQINSGAGDIPPPREPAFQARSRKRKIESSGRSGNISKVSFDSSALPVNGIGGVFAVDKPPGMTSHDVIDVVRGVLRGAKAGHAGTLDPGATGILVVCLGQATKVSSFLMEGSKVYEGWARLGIVTETYDADGAVVDTKPVECTKEEIVATSRDFVGAIEQIPPMFSAVKIGGQKLYRLARRGVEVERPSRKVVVDSFEILDVEPTRFYFRLRCSKGTYVRTIVHDLGQKLGCGAHLESLRRTEQGPFEIKDAVSWEEMRSEGAGESIARRVTPSERALTFLPSCEMESRLPLRVGAVFAAPADAHFEIGRLARLVSRSDRNFGVVRVEKEGLRVLYVAPSGSRRRREAP